MPVPEVDWWTRWLAIYGAVVATAGGIIQFLEHQKDRARISVSAMFAHDGNDPHRIKFLVSATNIGRQAVTVKGIASREGKANFLWAKPMNFPKLLQPTEEVLEWSNNLKFITDKTTELYVLDTNGNEWKLPKKKLNRLKKSAADYAAES
jgi:hypothetical protein